MAEHAREVEHTIHLWSALQDEWNSERNTVDHEYYHGRDTLKTKQSRLGQLERKKDGGATLTEKEEAELTELYASRDALLKQYDEVHEKVNRIGTKPTEENIQELKALSAELKERSAELKKLIPEPVKWLDMVPGLHMEVDENFTGTTDILDIDSRRVGRVTLKNGLKHGEMFFRYKQHVFIKTFDEDKPVGKCWRFVDDQLVAYKEFEKIQVDSSKEFEKNQQDSSKESEKNQQDSSKESEKIQVDSSKESEKNQQDSSKESEMSQVVLYIGFTNGHLDAVQVMNSAKMPRLNATAFFQNGMLYRYVEHKNKVHCGFECSPKWGSVVYRGWFRKEKDSAVPEKENPDVPKENPDVPKKKIPAVPKKEEYTRVGFGQAFVAANYFSGKWDGDKVIVNGQQRSWKELSAAVTKDGEYDPTVWTLCDVVEVKPKEVHHHHKRHHHRTGDYTSDRRRHRRNSEEKQVKATGKTVRSYYVLDSLSGKKDICICEDSESHHYWPFSCCYDKSGEKSYLNTSISLIPAVFRETFFGTELTEVTRKGDMVVTLPPPIQAIVDTANAKRKAISVYVCLLSYLHYGDCFPLREGKGNAENATLNEMSSCDYYCGTREYSRCWLNPDFGGLFPFELGEMILAYTVYFLSVSICLCDSR